MSGILRLESLTKGNTLKQGDKTPLKYRLFDADGEKLNIAGKSAKVRLVYPDFLTIGYEKDGLTVAQDDTVTFTIDGVIPSRIYHVEIIVDGQFIFPSRSDDSKFTVDKSSLGTEANIIEIVGKDVLINAVKSQVDAELQPLVTSLESAEQAETQRATAESSRVSAEEQRKTDHANRSAEFDGKADKVVIKNLIENGDFSINEISSNFVIRTALQESATINDGKLVLKPKTFAWNNYIQIDFPQNIGDKIYCRFTIESPIATNVDWRVGGVSRVMPYGPGESTISFVSTVSSVSSVNGIMYLYTQDFTPSMLIKLDNVTAINLTETFGAGNEPAKEEMDELIKVTGYIDSENGVSVKELLGHLMNNKANKKQEDWITPTLTGGWTPRPNAPIRFRKNELGNVELVGSISGGVKGPVFAFPAGYRPIYGFRFPAVSYLFASTGAYEPATVNVDPTGNFYVQNFSANAEVAINISFPSN